MHERVDNYATFDGTTLKVVLDGFAVTKQY